MTSPAAAPVPTPLTPDTSIRGRFLWYDLLVPDVDAATRFYPAVTGWTVTPWAMGEGQPPYLMWTNAAGPLGGVMSPPADPTTGPPLAHWLPYIGTLDVDATYAEAVALGAQTFIPPTDIPTVGRFAMLADPQGGMFAAFQPSNPSAPDAGMPGVGGMVWHELATTDRVASFEFYSRLFGWAPTEALDMGPAGVYQMFGRVGSTYGGIFDRMDEAISPQWMLYVHVPDMNRALDAVRQSGGQVPNGPMPIPGGDHVAHCVDPQGARFALHATGPVVPAQPSAQG